MGVGPKAADGDVDHRADTWLEVVLAGDEISSEAGGLGPREPRTDANSLGCVAALGDRSTEVVERRKRLAVDVRYEESNVFEPIREELGDPVLERVEPLARSRRNEERARVRVLDPTTSERIQCIDLVQHELHRDVVGADLGEHAADRGDRLARRSSGSDASATCRTRSATSVSSSVAAKPSTSCVGSRLMKPTVSVTR